MSEHTVSAYDEELTAMAGKIAEMGGLAEKAFADAVHALVSQDLDLAKTTISNDVRLDALHHEVEVKLIEAAPLAGALRFELLTEGRIVPRSRRPKADRWRAKSNVRRGRRRTAAR